MGSNHNAKYLELLVLHPSYLINKHQLNSEPGFKSTVIGDGQKAQ